MGALGVVRLVPHEIDPQRTLRAGRSADKPRWLCLHAAGGWGGDFRGIDRRLSGDVALVVPEFPRADVARPLAEDVAFTVALLERERTAPLLLGHSYGGLVALEVARQRPELIEQLVLVEPLALHLLRREQQAEVQQLRMLLTRVADLSAQRQRAEAARLFLSHLDESAWAKLGHEERLRAADAMPRLVNALHELADLPLTAADYRPVRVPTVLVRGTRSPWPLRWLTAQLTRALPDTTLFEIASAGHLSLASHPDELSFLLRRAVLHVRRTLAP